MATLAAPQTKVEIINGVKITLQKCACGTWFEKKRVDKESCSNRCAMRKSPKWQNRNNKTRRK